jgi:site-specific DNA-methyltransferase (adenine-specific)
MIRQLFYGDNLHVLRESLPDEHVDLIYLDPPFNSKRDYNILFKSPKGEPANAQITAFKDSWHWGDQTARELNEITKQPNTQVTAMVTAMLNLL